MRNTYKNTQQKGFLEVLVIILIALILLRFLGVDMGELFSKGWMRDFIAYAKDTIHLAWLDFLRILGLVKEV